MRSEQQMLDLILGVAGRDPRIRAVYMNGSRTNANAPKDIFQDYDIVYVVTETASFLADEGWVRVFGELLIKQEPDRLELPTGEHSTDNALQQVNNYGYLLLFADGNRIDLHIQTKEAMLEAYSNDSLTVPLLDKDGWLPEIPASSDCDYHTSPPAERFYLSCCNDFWWCLQNVAKGIWRDELPYAKEMFEHIVRDNLNRMVAWWIGTKHDFQVSPGKMGKYFKTFLPPAYWDMYKATYADGNYDNMWEAVFAACDLFRSLAGEMAAYFGYTYNADEDRNMTGYLKRVQNLPRDAREIY